MEEDKRLIFWLDGSYCATGGYFVRNNLKDFFDKIIESGKEPVGIAVDLESFNLEVMVKEKIND